MGGAVTLTTPVICAREELVMRWLWSGAVVAIAGVPAAAQPGQVWMAPAGGGPDGPVYAISSYSGDLVIGGDFEQVGAAAARNEARFRNGGWERLGDGLAADFGHTDAGRHGFVRAFYQDGGDLFMGGVFDDPAPGSAGIARFNGTDWLSLGTGVEGPAGSYVEVIHGFGGKIVAGGSFWSADVLPVANIAAWDDGVWTTFGAGTFFGGGNSAPVNAMATCDGKLIIGGSFLQIDGVDAPYIAQWDGEHWSPVGSGLYGAVRDLAIFDGELYACGNIQAPPGQSPAFSGVARFDEALQQWMPVGTSGADSTPITLEPHDGKLYMGGFFFAVDGVGMPMLAVWDGLTWSAPPGGGPDWTVQDLHSRGGDLYVGGEFNTVGGLSSPRLAVLTTTCPADLDGGGGVDVFDLLAYLDLWFTGSADAERTGDAPAAVDVFDLLVYLDGWFAGC
jgi:hypothetical protein